MRYSHWHALDPESNQAETREEHNSHHTQCPPQLPHNLPESRVHSHGRIVCVQFRKQQRIAPPSCQPFGLGFWAGKSSRVFHDISLSLTLV